MPTAALNIAIAADRVITEQENAWVCDSCSEALMRRKTCPICGRGWTKPKAN